MSYLVSKNSNIKIIFKACLLMYLPLSKYERITSQYFIRPFIK